MRFGIMAMQLEALIPAEITPSMVQAAVAEFDHARLVAGLAAQGFRHIELGGDLAMWLPHTFAPAAIEQLRELKLAQNLTYSVHLPLWSVEPASPLGPVRQGSVQAVLDCIAATRSLEPEVYVLHATNALAAEFGRMALPPLVRSVLQRQFQQHAISSLRTILAESGLPARRLAIETVEFPWDLTLEMAQTLDLGVCVDTGHVLCGYSGPVELWDVLDQCADRLVEVHLHDAPWQGPEHVVRGQDHQALGKGDLDVGRLLDVLAAREWSGPLVFELKVGEALASLDLIRHLRPQSVA